jgi:hypothetical protein
MLNLIIPEFKRQYMKQYGIAEFKLSDFLTWPSMLYKFRCMEYVTS